MMIRKLLAVGLFAAAISPAFAQSLQKMRLTPGEIKGSTLDNNQIGSSGIGGVHTKVLFGDPRYTRGRPDIGLRADGYEIFRSRERSRSAEEEINSASGSTCTTGPYESRD